MANRRDFMALSVAFAAFPAFSGARAQGSLGVPVETASGKIRGFLDDGVNVFRGIPYGTAERFKAAVSPEPWTGVRDMLGWGFDAPQGRSAPHQNAFSLVASDKSLQQAQSEDCLALNVWTSTLDANARRPVMVWLHGGGFVSGSASTAVHDGRNLARDAEVVVVSLNHRLNVLGFTHLDDPEFADSGNAGMLDITLALRWVQENIARFGGDPDNVTVFGYSGGGQKVSTLLAMPGARGLFHKAIVQSGQNPLLLSRDQAAGNTRALYAELGLTQGDARGLQSVALPSLMAAFSRVWTAPPRQTWGFPARFSPLVDGRIVPAHPYEAVDLSADVPLIIGSMREEMAGFTLMMDPEAFRMSLADLAARLEPYMGTETAQVIEGYRAIYPDFSPWDLYALISADAPTRINSILIAERRHALGAAPTFMYRVDWQTRVFDGLMKAPHGLEVPLVFRNVEEDSGLNGGGEDAFALSQDLSDAWVSFARSGRPDTPRHPWPAYDSSTRSTMLFDRQTRVESDPGAAERRLLDGFARRQLAEASRAT
ncbi:carboxylesterase/lipase family protein [Aurantiacibacter suaedae]|uniref:carboxylesterase/lipase family protein n=1 Tax=Aurantiacibacter suaedae TaxID=2545755 RepID=UPI0019D6977F|nr:carboxylesterase family protein [Aurantiacibacter suaedae]